MSNALTTAEETTAVEKATAAWRRSCEKFIAAMAQRKALTRAGIFAFTSLVAIVDFWTGDDVPLMILYLPAIIVACWSQRLSAGVALSLLCSILWLVDDFQLIEQSPQIVHKGMLSAIHFAFFVVVAVMTWRLRLAHEREHELARIDSLTGLLNRQAFVDAAELEMARCQRTGEPLAIAYLDCDTFKQVNDTLGHAAGDALLVAIAKTAAASIRRGDYAARLGGDEFACLLPGATEPEAEQVIARVKDRLDAKMRQHDWPVSFSIGLVIYTTPPEDVDQLIGSADELMYRVKHGQKNAVLTEQVGRTSKSVH